MQPVVKFIYAGKHATQPPDFDQGRGEMLTQPFSCQAAQL